MNLKNETKFARKNNQNECCCLFVFCFALNIFLLKNAFWRKICFNMKIHSIFFGFFNSFDFFVGFFSVFCKKSLWFKWKKFLFQFYFRRNLLKWRKKRKNFVGKMWYVRTYSLWLREFYLFSNKSCGLLQNILYCCEISKKNQKKRRIEKKLKKIFFFEENRENFE